jgi:hypothetical protein
MVLSDMLHRLINLVLAVLMLMPAGICTCDGGIVSCPDHPIHAPTQSLICVEVGQACGHVETAVEAATAPDSHDHHCPSPRPHQSACGVWAPEFLTDSTAADISTALYLIECDVVVEWPPLSESDRHAARTPLVPACPIYLAHCVLLI